MKLALSIILSVLILGCSSVIYEPIETYGEIIISNSANSSFDLKYYVNGKVYKGSCNLNTRGHVPGEIFKVIYEKSNPNDYQLLYTEPIFLDSEQVIIDTAVIKMRSPFSTPWISFTYKLGDERFVKSQMVTKEERKECKKGEKYLIRLSPYNAYRAIIDLDKPIK
jgi:hypothetical protein